MKSTVYNQSGKKAGDITLPDAVFGVPWNEALVHQVVVSMEANARPTVAHTKDRSDVRGGGRKPWRQKGTGRARHGSSRSPIWTGGGVTHGPTKEKSYAKSVNKKMRAKALFSVLSRKLKDGEVLFVDSISIKDPKTSEAKKALGALSKIKGFENLSDKKRNAGFVALAGYDAVVGKSFRNFGNIEVDEVRNLNPVDALKYKYLVIVDPEESIKQLETRL